MNKIPIKQSYLLAIIIVGILTLSVYSTYAIFTLESETDNIISIATPNNLELTKELYEYKQVIVPKNSYIYTDVDLYNNINDSLCYGIWYKVITNSKINENKIKIYENTALSLTTSGLINPVTSKRINILIINDNDEDAKINIGLSYEQSDDSCSLNLTSDRKLISTTIDSPQILSDNLIENTKIEDNEEGYLTYKDNKDTIEIMENPKIYVSNEFAYNEELFTLKEPTEIDFEKIDFEDKESENYFNINDIINYYTCLDTDNCQKLYRINSLKKEEKQIYIDNYDILTGYLKGEIGLNKIGDDYLYFGDNPHNFVYYNCQNESDISTCELWRIMGFYYNKENQKYITKIIKDSSIGTYAYNKDSNLWNNSEIFNYLNKDYHIINDNLLTKVTYKQQNIVDTDDGNYIISDLPDEFKSHITLMNLTDYLNASICKDKNISEYDSTCLNNNWLNKNEELNEFTMTIKYEMPTTDPETEEVIIPSNDTVYSVGKSIINSLITNELNIRPVLSLKERTFLISGEGTMENPYIIK